MQQHQKKINEKLFVCTSGSAWVAGLLIAGSDNPYMPWVNGFGLVLFFFASGLIARHLRLAHPIDDRVCPACSSQKKVCRSHVSKKRLKRIPLPIASIIKHRNLLWN